MRLLLICLRNLLSVLLWPIRAPLRARALGNSGRYVRLRLHQPLLPLPPEQPPLRDLLARLRRRPVHDLRSLGKLFAQLAEDPFKDGLLLHLDRLEAGWASVGELRAYLLKLRRAGKRVLIFSPSGGGARVLYLASAGDALAISPAGGVSFTGFASQSMYLADLLSRLGLSVQVNAQGPYKTAAEPLVSSAMSAAQHEQVLSLLNARHALVAEALSAKLSPTTSIETVLSEASLAPQRAQELGLVDHVNYEDGLPPLLGWVKGQEAPFMIDAARYSRLRKRPLLRPLRRPPIIAIVTLHGNIREGGGLSPGGITLEATTRRLRAVRKDKRVVGVLLHINSPGGSAMVSDLLHHEVERLAQEKPTVAFFADVAASGGYYIAAAAHAIVAAPEAITGSIGVVSLKVVVDKLLSRVGISPQPVRTSAHADMYSPTRPFDEAEQAVVERESARIYDRFLEVVAVGRKLPLAQVQAVAGGRVWSAGDALQHRLVDRIGPLDSALEELRGRIVLTTPEPVEAVVYPTPRGASSAMEEPPRGSTALPGLDGLDADPLAEWLWLLRQRERVLCYSPANLRDCRG